MAINTKQDLLNILADENDFAQQIRNDAAEVLSKCSVFGIYPEKKYLQSFKDVVVDKFIVDNYELNIDDLKYYTTVFDNQFCIKNLFKKPLNESELEELIKINAPIPKDTIFSPDFMNRNANYFEDVNYYIDQSIQASVRYFSLKDFLSLDPIILNKYNIYKENPDYFQNSEYSKLFLNAIKNKRTFSIDDFNNYTFTKKDKRFLIKVLKDIHHFYSQNSYEDYKKLNGFESVISKKEYFEKISDSTLSQFSIEEIKEDIDYFQDYFRKKIEKHNYLKFDDIYRANYTEFEKFEIIFNKDFIKSTLGDLSDVIDFSYMETRGGNNNTNSPLYKMLYLKNTYLEIMREKILTDPEFLQSLEDPAGYYRRLIRLANEIKRDQEKINKEGDIITSLMGEVTDKFMPIILKNEHVADLLIVRDIRFADYSNILKALPNMTNPNGLMLILKELKSIVNSSDATKDEFDSVLGAIKTIFVKTKDFDKKTASSYFSSYKKMIQSEIEESDSSNWRDKQYISQLKALQLTLAKDSLLNIINGNIDVLQYSENYNILSFENYKRSNQIQYKTDDYGSIRDFMFLYELDKKLPQYLFKAGLKINRVLLKEMIGMENDKWTVNFLSDYFSISENKKDLESDVELFASVMKSKNQSSFYQFNLTQEEQEKHMYKVFFLSEEFHRVDTLLDNLSDLANIRSSSLKKADNLDFNYDPEDDFKKISQLIDKSKKGIKSLAASEDTISRLNAYSSRVFSELQEESLRVSFDFVDSVIKSELNSGEFKRINELLHTDLINRHHDFLHQKIGELDKDIFLKLSKNKDFLSYIVEAAVSEIFPQGMSIDEKFKLCDELIAVSLNGQREKFINDESLKKVFSLFREDERDFISQYMIEKYPENLLNSYVFYPKIKEKKILFKNREEEVFISEMFSKEQILNIFQNIEKKHKSYFIEKDVNSRASTFFLHNYNMEYSKDSEENNQKVIKNYFEALNFFKEKNPAIYVLMLNHQLIETIYLSDSFLKTITEKERDEFKSVLENQDFTRNEKHNLFLSREVCFKTAIEGFEMIAKQIGKNNNNQTYERDGSRIALDTISDIFTGLSFEIGNYTSNRANHIKYEDLKFLVKNTLVISPEAVLKTYSLMDDDFYKISKEISNELNVEDVKAILFPRKDFVNESYGYKQDGEQTIQYRKLKDIATNIINSAVIRSDKEMLSFLNKELKFFNSISVLETSPMYKAIRERSDLNNTDPRFMLALINDKDFMSFANKAIFSMNLEGMLQSSDPAVVKRKKI